VRRNHKVVDGLGEECKCLVEFPCVGLHKLDHEISVEWILHLKQKTSSDNGPSKRDETTCVKVYGDDIRYKGIERDEDADVSDQVGLVEPYRLDSERRTLFP